MESFHGRRTTMSMFGWSLSVRPNALWLLLNAALFAIGIALVLGYARIDPEQQMAQKIFYFHVPSAWTAFLAYGGVCVSGLAYLRTRDKRWDDRALAMAEVGTLFCTLVLITGPIWARPIWGRAWSWEPRLTTTLILFLIYLGYFMVRQFGGSMERSARLSAIVGILAFLDVPIIYWSVKFWAAEVQSHPQAEMGGQPGDVLATFLFMLGTFTSWMAYLVRYKTHLARWERGVRNLVGG